MAAGLSKEQQYRIEYRELHRIQRQLLDAGIESQYNKRALYGTKAVGVYVKDGLRARIRQFVITYNRMNASNGECCLYPNIQLHLETGSETWAGWWQNNSYKRGIERIKELFSK